MPEIRAASRAAHQDEHLIGQLESMRALLGNILQPGESWLLDSRLPTLRLRMRHQGENAAQIVEALSEHPAIERIHYPPHFEEPEQRRIFEAQRDHLGAVFSMELSGGKKPAFDFLRSLRISSNSVSLGGMESLARHPATTTASE